MLRQEVVDIFDLLVPVPEIDESDAGIFIEDWPNLEIVPLGLVDGGCQVGHFLVDAFHLGLELRPFILDYAHKVWVGEDLCHVWPVSAVRALDDRFDPFARFRPAVFSACRQAVAPFCIPDRASLKLAVVVPEDEIVVRVHVA